MLQNDVLRMHDGGEFRSSTFTALTCRPFPAAAVGKSWKRHADGGL